MAYIMVGKLVIIPMVVQKTGNPFYPCTLLPYHLRT